MRPPLSRPVLAVLLIAALAACRNERGANERQAFDDVADFAAASMRALAANHGCLAPELLLENQQIVGLVVPARFGEPVRRGYRFTFDGFEPQRRAWAQPAYGGCSYVAVPERPGATGQRSFAFFSYRQTSVFTREDGQPPTINDGMISIAGRVR